MNETNASFSGLPEDSKDSERVRQPWSRRPGVLPAVVLLLLLIVLDVVAIWRQSIAMPSLSWGNERFNRPSEPLVHDNALLDAMRINLNTASAADLQLLPGIGPALAERIVRDRREHGAFATLDALIRVHGIGPVTIDSIRPYVEPIRTSRAGGG